MKRSLLLLLVLFSFSTISFSQQTTVNYDQQAANYGTPFITNSSYAGLYNNTSTDINLYSLNSTDQVVAWRPFNTDGSANTANRRSLQVGDVFTIYCTLTRVQGTMGIALLSNPTSKSSWADKEENYVISLKMDGPDILGTNTWGNWYVQQSYTNSTTYASTGGYMTNYHTYTIQFSLNAPDRMSILVQDITGGITSEILNYSDVKIDPTLPITDYSIFLQDCNDGDTYQNVHWGSGSYTTNISNLRSTGTPNLGQSGNTITEDNVIPDGIYADQTTTPYPNELIVYGPGNITLTAANTYSGGTLIHGAYLKLNCTSGNALLSTSNVTVQNSGTLEVATNQTLKNLTVENGGSLTIDNGATLTITGTLTDNGGTTITNNGNIIIAPNAVFLNSSAVPNVTLQQNITAQRGYRIFANPFTTVQNDLSGAGLNATVTTANDVKTYSNTTDAWVSAGNGYNSLNIPGNTPYACFIRGATIDNVSGLNYTDGPSAFTYSVTGILNSGNVTITPSTAGNFMLVGNPYAAPVNTSALTGGPGIPYYVYTITQGSDPTAQRTKAGSWVAQTASSTSNTIPVLGTIIYQPSSTSSYDITTSGINTGGIAQTSLFGGANSNNTISDIELQVESQGNYEDKLFVRLDNAATIKSNDKIDLAKFPNDNVNVYTISPDNKHLAIDARNSFDVVSLGLKASNANYTFRVNNNSLPDGTTVHLIDKYSNTSTELVTGATYNFSVTSDSLSQGEKRFELQFSTNKTTATIDNSPSEKLSAIILDNVTNNNQVTVQVSGSQSNTVTIRVVDMNGKIINTLQGVNGTNQVNISQAGSGMTLLQISDGKNTVIKKVIKM